MISLSGFPHDGDVGSGSIGCVFCVLMCDVLWSNSGNSLLRSRSDDAVGRSFVLCVCRVELAVESLSGNRHSEDVILRRAVC